VRDSTQFYFVSWSVCRARLYCSRQPFSLGDLTERRPRILTIPIRPVLVLNRRFTPLCHGRWLDLDISPSLTHDHNAMHVHACAIPHLHSHVVISALCPRSKTIGRCQASRQLTSVTLMLSTSSILTAVCNRNAPMSGIRFSRARQMADFVRRMCQSQGRQTSRSGGGFGDVSRHWLPWFTVSQAAL
jgi:hypothetical protein